MIKYLVHLLPSLFLAAFIVSCMAPDIKDQEGPLSLLGLETQEFGPAYKTHAIEEFGPIKEGLKKQNTSLVKKDPVLAISFGPSLNRVSAQISFLKVLEKHRIRPQIFTGVEMGAIVAALYAQAKSAEKLEWYFYKFFRDTENVTPYSNKWLSLVKNDLLDLPLEGKCKSMRVESLKSFLFIPLYNHKIKKLEYRSSGNLCDLLIQNLSLYPNQKSSYVSAMQWNAFSAVELKKRGVDFIIGVDTLNAKVDLNTPDGTLLGIFLKAQTLVQEEAKFLDYFVTLPASEALLDGRADLALIGRKSMEYTETIVSELLFEIRSLRDHNR